MAAPSQRIEGVISPLEPDVGQALEHLQDVAAAGRVRFAKHVEGALGKRQGDFTEQVRPLLRGNAAGP
ncbi:hypothetical protein D3C77_807260 [compost metagenome]